MLRATGVGIQSSVCTCPEGVRERAQRHVADRLHTFNTWLLPSTVDHEALRAPASRCIAQSVLVFALHRAGPVEQQYTMHGLGNHRLPRTASEWSRSHVKAWTAGNGIQCFTSLVCMSSLRTWVQSASEVAHRAHAETNQIRSAENEVKVSGCAGIMCMQAPRKMHAGQLRDKGALKAVNHEMTRSCNAV